MSSTTKIISAIIALAVVGGAAYWYWTEQAMAPSEYEAAPNSPSSSLPTAKNDTSSQALDQDMAAIDAQLTAAASESNNVDRSLNDQPVQQSQL